MKKSLKIQNSSSFIFCSNRVNLRVNTCHTIKKIIEEVYYKKNILKISLDISRDNLKNRLSN